MNRPVDVAFDCLPLRSVTRFDVPLDAPPEYEELVAQVKQASEKHGLHNTYYLHNARCIYYLTNNAEVGMLEFRFHGTALTDPDDRTTLHCDLDVQLVRETCDWITEPIVSWFADSVVRAVQVEFDQYIASGDLQKTVERLARIEAESDAHDGFLGMGL